MQALCDAIAALRVPWAGCPGVWALCPKPVTPEIMVLRDSAEAHFDTRHKFQCPDARSPAKGPMHVFEVLMWSVHLQPTARSREFITLRIL